MWETVFNILKLVGIAGGVIAAFVASKIWLREQNEQGISKTKDTVINLLRTELEVSRAHCDQADKTVEHYRDEMHDTRNECDGKISKAMLERDLMFENLKQVEIANASLLAKTDLSPMMDVMTDFVKEQKDFVSHQRGFVAEQTKINHELVTALKDINTSIHTLVERQG